MQRLVLEEMLLVALEALATLVGEEVIVTTMEGTGEAMGGASSNIGFVSNH